MAPVVDQAPGPDLSSVDIGRLEFLYNERILVLTAGGTVTWTSANYVQSKLRDVIEAHPNVCAIDSVSDHLSESMTPRAWGDLGAAIDAKYQEHQATGLVVLHGTDTMAWSTAAMSFALRHIDAPIVFTGAMTPFGHPHSDADANVSEAIATVSVLPKGVYLAFGHKIYWGNRVRKVYSRDCIYSAMTDPVGHVYGEHVSVGANIPVVDGGVVAPHYEFSSDAMLLQLHPGIRLRSLSSMLVDSGMRGVVVQMYGSFTGPDDMVGFVERCSDNGVMVFGTTSHGIIDEMWYPSKRGFVDHGGVLLPNIMPETALVKLMWALAGPDAQTRDTVSRNMAAPIAGEFVQ